MTAIPPAPVDGVRGDVVLAARGIRKSFDSVEVLHGVDFVLHRGEVHGLVGQNGAGKSTLVKIIEGAYSGDAGEIEINGTPVAGGAAGRARRRAIAMVFQEFSLIPTMPVGQNICLTREPTGWSRLIDDGEVRRRAKSALARLGADIDPDRNVEELPVGSRQLVEIAKAISQNASILILDEPTASLTAAEIRALTEAIGRLTAEGIAIVFISHHLDEVVSICDRVTVLRDGRVTLVAETHDLTLATIIEAMLGRSLESTLTWQAHDVDRGEQPLLRVSGLTNDRVHDVSFELRRGEILGLAGLLGSGRSELMHAVFGIDQIDAGTIEMNGRRLHIHGPADALRAGIALVPEDRGRAGLVREHSVAHNILMASWKRVARAGFIDDRAAKGVATGFIEQLRIQTAGLEQLVKGLSGGNQQKVVVAKNLAAEPGVLLLDDPTVGVDVGSRREILEDVRTLATRGNGVVLVSSEFEELSGLADRVLIMRGGAVHRELDRWAGDDLSEEALSRAVQE